MMKKQLSVFLLFLVCSATALASVAASEEKPSNRPWLQWFGEAPQHHHHHHHPPSQPPKWDPKVVKCLQDFHVEKKCARQILASLWHRKVSVGPECCNIVNQLSEDCAETVFAGLTHSFFTFVLKQYCAHHRSAPPPKA
ncbi:hypothetical protein P3X46_022752 [Hevea brasiliensis]|uniref:Prolamin-like domain-containing protein n=1 Tax=Hevea brasiliensis TaxID=3981 RepID=A0ABQ9LC69_HEVBR|nr:uncharacterized protein LOC110660273 [Hevea brasiliensis]KAJ9163030.1 hypothetical protein P3X46_022752 [Hevea brasiliensis]